MDDDGLLLQIKEEYNFLRNIYEDRKVFLYFSSSVVNKNSGFFIFQAPARQINWG